MLRGDAAADGKPPPEEDGSARGRPAAGRRQGAARPHPQRQRGPGHRPLPDGAARARPTSRRSEPPGGASGPYLTHRWAVGASGRGATSYRCPPPGGPGTGAEPSGRRVPTTRRSGHPGGAGAFFLPHTFAAVDGAASRPPGGGPLRAVPAQSRPPRAPASHPPPVPAQYRLPRLPASHPPPGPRATSSSSAGDIPKDASPPARAGSPSPRPASRPARPARSPGAGRRRRTRRRSGPAGRAPGPGPRSASPAGPTLGKRPASNSNPCSRPAPRTSPMTSGNSRASASRRARRCAPWRRAWPTRSRASISSIGGAADGGGDRVAAEGVAVVELQALLRLAQEGVPHRAGDEHGGERGVAPAHALAAAEQVRRDARRSRRRTTPPGARSR